MLSTGATVGILGGGQLGRMLAMAAADLGLKTCVFEPGGDCPASHVANFHLKAGYDDHDSLKQFAEACDVVTYEFENVPTDALDVIEAIVPIHPGREALRISQDRLTEKQWLESLGLTVAPYAVVDDAEGLRAAADKIGRPSILKTRRFGYDGKGQVRITEDTDLDAAWNDVNAPAVLEGHVAFDREVSVIGARGQDGRVACFDPGENLHEGGILRRTEVPATLTPGQTQDAVLLTGRILNALDYVGVIGVELFVTRTGLLVNEIAPRVHNSGHWTQDGCLIDQFDQHIRAVAGWPLGDGRRHTDAVMENLIGDDMDRVPDLAADPGAALHLYGKGEVRAGRKMGHVNRLSGRNGQS